MYLIMFSKLSLAKKIEMLRKKRGLSQEKLARLADVSNNTIVNIEAGLNTKLTQPLKLSAKLRRHLIFLQRN